MTVLNETARADFLSANPTWELDGETISKTYVLADFNEAVGFVMRVALIAEVADHHPDIDIRWNKVTIALTTHDAGGLTAKDTDLAEQMERF